MNRVIEITISPKGKTTVATKGFQGSACKEASRFIEEAIGTRRDEKLTTEFYQSAAISNQVHARG